MRSRLGPSGRPFWLCAVLLLASVSARGATLYSAQALAFPFAPPDMHEGPAPVSAFTGFNASVPRLQQLAEASASAGLSLAGAASASVSDFNQPPLSFSASATGIARFSGYDVILSGPSGESTLTSLNLIFDGTAGVSIGASLTGPSGTSTDGWAGPGPLALTTSPLLVGAGDVITIGLTLTVSASCSTNPQANLCSASARARSFSFPTTGPVFNLPAGWTANSVDETIVNNAFIPEPSTALLLVGGVVGLSGLRSRRAHRDRAESPW